MISWYHNGISVWTASTVKGVRTRVHTPRSYLDTIIVAIIDASVKVYGGRRRDGMEVLKVRGTVGKTTRQPRALCIFANVNAHGSVKLDADNNWIYLRTRSQVLAIKTFSFKVSKNPIQNRRIGDEIKVIDLKKL